MAWRWQKADTTFFEEKQNRTKGSPRSIQRAETIARHLGALPQQIPVVAIVGSKGKGTAAIYASATLTAAGLRVVTITSPSLIENNERIRVNGQAIDDQTYTKLAARISAARQAIPMSDTGYLSPSGAFTVAGIMHAQEIKADVVVCEEGLGGTSDEISLFTPISVGLAPVFVEHAAILGNSLQEIAGNLLGVVTQETRAIVSGPQLQEVEQILTQTATRTDTTITRPKQQPADIVLPPGLGAANATLGITLGYETAKLLKKNVDDSKLAKILATIQLPGRLSQHQSPTGATWLVDAAVSPAGMRAALKYCKDTIGKPDVILAFFLNVEEVDACRQELSGETVITVTTEMPQHLVHNIVQQGTRPTLFGETIAGTDQKYQRILALGRMGFISETLGYLQANYRYAYLAE